MKSYHTHRKVLWILTLVFAMLIPVMATGADTITLKQVNDFLNTSAKLGEGSKANQIAIIPISHIDGPQEEDLFYGFVSFKYMARDYIKYQVTYLSCTCRSADVNYWSTAYVELTLPGSGLLKDAKIQTLSFGKDGTNHYNVGFWGDSSPIPTDDQSFELINKEYVSYYIGKSYADIKDLSTIDDISEKEYQAGKGREKYTLDAYSGATVSTNNILRMLQALFKFHGQDSYFENDPAVKALLEASAEKPAAQKKSSSKKVQVETSTQELAALPAPVDLSKTYKPSKDAKKEVACTKNSFGPACSSIDKSNFINYLYRPDIFYIDLRDHGDYMKKHFRNFEVIPFFGLIYNKDAHTNPALPHLYGGSLDKPVPVYKEKSDTILKALIPKDKIVFLMCQSGGRVGMLMKILAARGWDMSKIYNIGGLAQYSGKKYRPFITDTPELLMDGKYRIEGLTRDK